MTRYRPESGDLLQRIGGSTANEHPHPLLAHAEANLRASAMARVLGHRSMRNAMERQSYRRTNRVQSKTRRLLARIHQQGLPPPTSVGGSRPGGEVQITRVAARAAFVPGGGEDGQAVVDHRPRRAKRREDSVQGSWNPSPLWVLPTQKSRRITNWARSRRVSFSGESRRQLSASNASPR
jgi:hypothetical protein